VSRARIASSLALFAVAAGCGRPAPPPAPATPSGAAGGATTATTLERVVEGEAFVQALDGDGDDLVWVAERSVRRLTLSAPPAHTIATIGGDRVPSAVRIVRPHAYVLSMAGEDRAIVRVPLAGGPVEALATGQVSSLARADDGVLWVERTGAGSRVVKFDNTRGASTVTEFAGMVGSVALDATSVWAVLTSGPFGPTRLVRRDRVTGADRVVYESERQLVVIGADDRRVYLLDRRGGSSLIATVLKDTNRAGPLFHARAPGELVLSPVLCAGRSGLFVTELDPSADSTSGSIWRIGARPGDAVVLGRASHVPRTPACAADAVFFVDVDPATGRSDLVRIRHGR